jgi:hypothetical protein
MWESHQDFIPMIEASWGTTTCNSMHGLQEKLKGLSGSMSSWGRDFGNVRQELKTLRLLLIELRAAQDRVGPSHQELKVVEQIVELQHREKVMWRQWSRIQWLSEGDRNTRFFHMRGSTRNKRNRIECL